jgi:hypothetical protein
VVGRDHPGVSADPGSVVDCVLLPGAWGCCSRLVGTIAFAFRPDISSAAAHPVAHHAVASPMTLSPFVAMAW